MEGHKIVLGLFLVLVASGCSGISGDAQESTSFDSLVLDIDEVEKVTGAEYRQDNASEEAQMVDINFDSIEERTNAFFRREDNLTEAPKTVQSMVLALNGTEEKEVIESNKTSIVDIDGYTARKLESKNKTVLYGREENISFIVKTEEDGLYNSSRSLYLRVAQRIDNFQNKTS